ncbi:MAG TPA: M48 family metalloprotease, partial [Elusimicrobiota bacterium]|nr:M48 family metalloprotease [Elusimicrobiota bacterium]
MKRLKLAVPLAAVLVAGCSALQNLDVSSMTGGRVSNDRFQAMTKAASAARGGFADISESEEYYIGRAVSARILSRYKPLNDPGPNLYAQRILQAVAMASDRPAIYKGYHVQILRSPEVNAFSAPGGFVFVTTGLLKLVRSEDELACVLGHEVAHVSKKHGLKTIKASRLTSAFAILGTEAARSYSPSQVAQLTDAFKGTVDD